MRLDSGFDVVANICEAQTPSARIYNDPEIYALAREAVFARSWRFMGDSDSVRVPGQVAPVPIQEGCLEEPLLLARGMDDVIRCLSNVCTHRGHIVSESGGVFRSLRCRYHGRRFGLDGVCQHMPEFEGVVGFPCPSDNLPQVPLGGWGKFLFASLSPEVSFDAWIAPMRQRMQWLPLENMTLDATRTREFLVRANWALYVENYLDALHIPFVHAELSEQIDVASYALELHPSAITLIATAQAGEERFTLPESSPDYGQSIAAFYFWLFPNLMFNFYPWGVSINVVRPVAPNLTKVQFLRYVWDGSRLGSGVGDDAAVDRVEREDEAVVEATQKGVRSRLYDRGRYSPTGEIGTHHFHRMLVAALRRGESA